MQTQINQNFFSLIFLILLLIPFWGCDTIETGNVDQQRIETEFTMTYDMRSDQTFAQATFYADNTYLVLTSPARVTFQDEQMTLNENSDFPLYHKNTAGMVESGRFIYLDLDGITYANTIILTDSIAVADTLYLSLSGDGLVVWEGRALAQQEKVYATIKLSDGTKLLAETTEEQADTVAFNLEEVGEEYLGEHQIVVARHTRFDLQEKTEAGGSLYSEFRSKPGILIITN